MPLTAHPALAHGRAAGARTPTGYHAAARGIRIESVESKLERDLDLQGFLGLSNKVRRGYKQSRVNYTIKSSASAKE